MDCENVPRRTRGRGAARGRIRAGRRGAMRRRGTDVCERVVLQALEEINNLDIETLSSGQPQERCQKRRRVCSPRCPSRPEYNALPPPSSPSMEVSEVDGEGRVCEADPPPHSPPSPPSPGIYLIVCSDSPATSPTPAPSAEQGPPQQQSPDCELVYYHGYGSEADLTGESDDEGLLALLPRTVRSLMDTPFD